ARDTILRAVLRPHRQDVAWVTRAEGDLRVGRAPLDVSPRLVDDLYGDRASILATSATLTAGGSFDFVARRLGFGEADTLLVDSPYDYRQAVVALLAQDLPEPGMP